MGPAARRVGMYDFDSADIENICFLYKDIAHRAPSLDRAKLTHIHGSRVRRGVGTIFQTMWSAGDNDDQVALHLNSPVVPHWPSNFSDYCPLR